MLTTRIIEPNIQKRFISSSYLITLIKYAYTMFIWQTTEPIEELSII